MKRLALLTLVLLALLGLIFILKYPFKYSVLQDGTIAITKYKGFEKVVIIPDTINGKPVTIIDSCAFFGSSRLTTITVSANVTTIRNQAFAFCTSLTNVLIPKSVTTIWVEAFIEDFNLAKITVDADNPAFSSVAGILFNKNQTTLIQYPTSLTGSYVIPTGVTTIGHGAFAYSRLASISIPNGVTNIDDMAFWVCTNLTRITIPPSVTHIGTFAFAGSTNLKAIFFQGNAPSVKDAWGLEQAVFDGSDTTVYYLPGTTGWGARFDGCSTALWKQ